MLSAGQPLGRGGGLSAGGRVEGRRGCDIWTSDYLLSVFISYQMYGASDKSKDA